MTIKDFIDKWTGRGNEKQETQQFWNDLIFNVLNAPSDTEVQYEKPVKINGQTKFIDGYLPDTLTLIEQKSLGVSLTKAEKQSDGVYLTPYEQGRRYGGYLPKYEQPRWIIDSNFEEIRIHDMNKPGDPPEVIYLKDLEKDYTRLKFLINTEDEHIKKEFEVSVKAGEIVGILYDKLLAEYKDPTEHDLQSLNRVCVRIVFCLYAEDAGLFGNNTHAFHDYMAQFNGPARFRNGLKELFSTFNTPIDKRDPYLDPELMAFPYVNGGLFADDDLTMPFFTPEIVEIILEKASDSFDWSDISPTIFGAIFESTLNPETRRSGGMHYTSIENIHKVIDPLFLDELKAEFETIKAEPVDRTRNKKLKTYQDKLASLKFLDPACGSGNFLTESYICLRLLENKVLAELQGNQIQMAFEQTESPIKVSINQFYGIEINDFACSTAQTAMWIAEAKMMKATETIINEDFEFFPLTNNVNIVEGNALHIDWNDVIPASQLNYIMGNPPFVGSKYSNAAQKSDMDVVYAGLSKKYRKLDYVTCWYIKACQYAQNTNIGIAYVSTNSITQGEQVDIFWPIIYKLGFDIFFAYRTFKWGSEANNVAGVSCIILGLCNAQNITCRYIYDTNGIKVLANNINGYLIDAPNVIVSSRNKPICSNIHSMVAPNKPCDYNHLKLDPAEKEEMVSTCPNSIKWIKKMCGATEFINNKDRYCLWLVGCSPAELKSMPLVLKRVEQCKEARLEANTAESIKLAETPMLFREQMNPDNYIIVPCVSSENRRYIPIGFLDSNTIPVMGTVIIPDGNIYEFGILTSNVHMAWVRTVCGRLESRYRYSKDIVYNNYPWPDPTPEQKTKIEKTAQGILDARAKFPDSSLADLYDELTMPKELRDAHRANDRAVMEAYGFSPKMTEQECVAELMKMYQKLTEGK